MSAHCVVPPPYVVFVEIPSMEGELTLGVQDHFTRDPVAVQVEQIGKVGGNKA